MNSQIDIDAIAKQLGVPLRIFAGEPMSSNSYDYALAEKARMERLQKWVEKRIVQPFIDEMVDDVVNPLQFAYLLPLGKKLFARKYPKGKAPKPRITWEG